MSGFQINKGKEAQQRKAFTHVLADVPGGGVLVTSELTEPIVSEGSPLGRTADGKWHIIKTAKIAAKATASATTYTVNKGHNITTSDYLTFAKSGKAYKVSSVATNASDPNLDDITVSTSLGAAEIGDILIQAKASTADSSAYAFEPFGLLGKSYNVTPNLFVQIVTAGQIYGDRITGLGRLADDLPLIKVI